MSMSALPALAVQPPASPLQQYGTLMDIMARRQQVQGLQQENQMRGSALESGTGTNQIGDEVRPAYKAVYASLKDAVNDAVPEVADLNDRLTNLHAAQDDLLRLSRSEEVSRGTGPAGGRLRDEHPRTARKRGWEVCASSRGRQPFYSTCCHRLSSRAWFSNKPEFGSRAAFFIA